MERGRLHVGVVGAGVIGLSVAKKLLEDGRGDVTVIAGALH